jgi:hypothetical protein
MISQVILLHYGMISGARPSLPSGVVGEDVPAPSLDTVANLFGSKSFCVPQTH